MGFSAGLTQAAGEGETFWPERGAVPLAHELVVEEGDGVSMERLLISGGNLTLVMRYPAGWVVVGDPPSRYSFAFRHEIRPELTVGFARFGGGAFLRDLSEGSWEAYRRGLYATYGDGLEILEEPHGMAFGEGTVILGERNRAILYRPDAAGDLLRLEYFLFHRDGLLAIRLEGPEALVEANRERVELMLSRIAPR